MNNVLLSSALRKLMTYLVSVVIFGGLPVLAYTLPGGLYFESWVRTAFVALVVLLNLPAVLVLPHEGRGSGKGIQLQAQHRLSLLALQVLPLLVVVGSPWSAAAGFLQLPGQVVPAVGLGVFVLGFFLMNWSVYVLGKQFSVDVTLQADHVLIRTGPFAVVRHPRYLGIIVCFTGISLVFGSVLGLLVTGALVLVLLWRIADEERLLAGQFGDEWTAYRKGTWRLVPLLF